MTSELTEILDLPPDQRYLDRVKRKVRVLTALEHSGLGVFLTADENVRRQSINRFVRSIARTSERDRISPTTYAEAQAMVIQALERMQSVLPHDVQYRYRERKRF